MAKLVYAQDLGSCGRRPCGFKSLPRHLGSVVQLWQRRQIQDLEVVGSNPIGATEWNSGDAYVILIARFEQPEGCNADVVEPGRHASLRC